MIPTSAAFHEAIRNDEPQMPLFIFNNTVISVKDIYEEGGFRFSENVMKQGDFVPGICCSANLNCQLINDFGQWSDFEYGEYKALLGVRTYHQNTMPTTPCYIRVDGNTIEGWDEQPYLRVNGNAVAGVTEPVKALVLFEEKLLAFTDTGYRGYSYNGGNLTPYTLNIYDAPIIHNSERWKRLGYGIVYGHSIPNVTTGLAPENCFTIFGKTSVDSYEMIPLGIFEAERPLYSSVKLVDMETYDRMSKLDKKYKAEDFSYPTTVYGLLSQVCTVAGVPLESTSVTNGDLSISSTPEFGEVTLREVVTYIGQITGSFTRINRYGRMVMTWFTPVNFQLTGHDYSECNQGYYNVASVDQIVVRDVDKDDETYGVGENIVYIQQNPIARVLGGG